MATSCKTIAGRAHGHSLSRAWPAKDPAVIQPLPAQPCFSLCSEEQETQVFIEIYVSWLIQLFDNTLKTKPNWSAKQIQLFPHPGGIGYLFTIFSLEQARLLIQRPTSRSGWCPRPFNVLPQCGTALPFASAKGSPLTAHPHAVSRCCPLHL